MIAIPSSASPSPSSYMSRPLLPLTSTPMAGSNFVTVNEPGGLVPSCLPATPNIGPYDFTIFGLWHDQRTDSGLSGCASFGSGGCGVFHFGLGQRAQPYFQY